MKLGIEPYEVEIDLMTPIDPDKSPKVHVPPLNHVGLWVDHLESAVEWMTDQGVRFTPGGIRKGAAGHNVVFIHPKGNEEAPIGGAGVLIELVQAPESLIQKHSQWIENGKSFDANCKLSSQKLAELQQRVGDLFLKPFG